MSDPEYNIDSFEDLEFAREQIKKDLKEQEMSFKQNPVVKISSSLLGANGIQENFTNKLSVGNRRSGSNMVNTLLLASKFTRKYFIAYTIAKEMVPFTLNKIKGIFKK